MNPPKCNCGRDMVLNKHRKPFKAGWLTWRPVNINCCKTNMTHTPMTSYRCNPSDRMEAN